MWTGSREKESGVYSDLFLIYHDIENFSEFFPIFFRCAHFEKPAFSISRILAGFSPQMVPTSTWMPAFFAAASR